MPKNRKIELLVPTTTVKDYIVRLFLFGFGVLM